MPEAARISWLVLIGLLALSAPIWSRPAPPKARPDSAPHRALLDLPDLYQMASQSEVTVLATVKEIARFATFEVQEVYGGAYRRTELRVMYRSEVWERRLDGAGGFRFHPGERYLLFLRYHREAERKSVVAQDLFVLTDGTWGRTRLEAEGARVYIEAMRLLLGASSRPEISQQRAVMVGLLASPNHLAAAAAMSQAYERHLGSMESIPVLLAQMDRGIAGLRLGALKLLRRLAPTLPTNTDRASLAQAIYRRVAWEGADPIPVRLEAVTTLARLGPAALTTLEQASRSDADQTVRYQAAVAALQLKS